MVEAGKAAVVLAKHILEVAPKSAKVVYQNNVVRVILTTMRKGQRIPMHSHIKGFSYSLNSGRIRITTEARKSFVTKVKKGDAEWSEADGKGETHAVENLGGVLQELYVEFKS